MRRIAPAGLLFALAACTEQDATSFERATDSFFASVLQFFLVMMLIGALAVLLWALVIGGGIAAIFAGLRRVRGGTGEPPPPETAPASEDGSAPRPAAVKAPARTADPVGIGMMVFGGVLLLMSAPAVFAVSAGPSGAGEVSIPLPIIVIGLVLLLKGRRRTNP